MPGGADEVEQLLYAYAEAIDAGDFAAIGSLFAHGAVADASGTVLARGAGEVEALYTGTTRRYADGTPRTRHLVSNVIVDVDVDAGTAVCRSCFTVLQATDGLTLQPIIAGRYHDTFTRDADGRWWFAERRMQPELLGDLRHHLLFDPALIGAPPPPRKDPA